MSIAPGVHDVSHPKTRLNAVELMNAVINFGKVSAGLLWNPQISLLRPAMGCWILVLLIAHSA